MDDRDNASSTALLMETGLTQNSLAEQEEPADISNGNCSDKDATATIPFNGPGIEIYGLKSSQSGLADVKMIVNLLENLSFYTAEQLKRCP